MFQWLCKSPNTNPKLVLFLRSMATLMNAACWKWTFHRAWKVVDASPISYWNILGKGLSQQGQSIFNTITKMSHWRSFLWPYLLFVWNYSLTRISLLSISALLWIALEASCLIDMKKASFACVASCFCFPYILHEKVLHYLYWQFGYLNHH